MLLGCGSCEEAGCCGKVEWCWTGCRWALLDLAWSCASWHKTRLYGYYRRSRPTVFGIGSVLVTNCPLLTPEGEQKHSVKIQSWQGKQRWMIFRFLQLPPKHTVPVLCPSWAQYLHEQAVWWLSRRTSGSRVRNQSRSLLSGKCKWLSTVGASDRVWKTGNRADGGGDRGHSPVATRESLSLMLEATDSREKAKEQWHKLAMKNTRRQTSLRYNFLSVFKNLVHSDAKQ